MGIACGDAMALECVALPFSVPLLHLGSGLGPGVLENKRLCAVPGHLVTGFTNRDLVERTSALLARPYSRRQATYDLRRLKRKRLIVKLSGRQRYQLTPDGRRIAVLFTKT
jgi:hypothetical protein